MAQWKMFKISEIVRDIDAGKLVLPVIQRPLVWNEEKMELLFDTLLRGDSFGGIMAIEEDVGVEPLFNYRPFTKDGNFIASKQVGKIEQTQLFIIDGQQRLQSFYIGLKGTIRDKDLYFDLYSDFTTEYEFQFEQNEKNLDRSNTDNKERKIPDRLWYPVKVLFNKLQETNDEDQVTEEIIAQQCGIDEVHKAHISKNIKAFYRNIMSIEALGISIVKVNKSLDPVQNRQRIVELFRRLNMEGTKLSTFDLFASKLKGYAWEMEDFLRTMLLDFEQINLTQDNLIKFIFLLRGSLNKEMSEIEEEDAKFVVENSDRLTKTFQVLTAFLTKAKFIDFYKKEGNTSFIPLHCLAYHLFYLKVNNNDLISYFDNFETNNNDFIFMKKWLTHSLFNGVFKSRGAGWVPYKTGIRKLYNVLKEHKGKPFPVNELFSVYKNHPVKFTQTYNKSNLNILDRSFIYYVLYGDRVTSRVNDEDHIMPKNILRKMQYSSENVNSIANMQLLDPQNNRGNKSGKPFTTWINDPKYVRDKEQYISVHLIPIDETLWDEKHFKKFLEARAELILKKLNSYL